jgi:hypothetical protein
MEHLQYLIINNGIFVPERYSPNYRTNLVYGSDYRIIEESCILRGKGKSENPSQPPEYFSFDEKEPLQYVDDRLLFMGPFMREHYGHLLVEGISRYWFVMKNLEKNWKIPTPRNPFGMKVFLKSYIKPASEHWKKMMNSFDIRRENILFTRNPIKAKEIIIPECSMYSRGPVNHQHLYVTRKIAKKIIRGSKIDHDSRPLYLSRVKLKKYFNNFIGEETIEKYCKDIGCKIIYPEKLSLKEQIILFNKHDVFIGCIGSAFHSTLLRFVNRKAINIYFCSNWINPNFPSIDKLMENQSHYIECMDPLPDKSNTFMIDTKKGITALRGVL